ncbi:MAG: PAS domain-containing protein [Chloroflexi bacterium]|nr:PAS domain-containing protein [Chloroflexota bacterium]
MHGETVRGGVAALHRPHDQSTVWVSTSAAPIRAPDGAVMGVVSTFTDITELHELQQQREDFLRMVSHDLRAPLTVIQGHAQLLQRALERAGLSAYRGNVDAIGISARRMDAMIRDLVDSARLEAGQIRLERVPVNLGVFVADLLERSRPLVDLHRIQVAVPLDLPPVPADPDRLERILTNLLSNALKYSPPTAEVLVSARQDGAVAEITVADRGVGIAPDDQVHLFERYFRAKGTRRTEGLGLGLYIARLLVEAHGGRIWATSKPGQGSTFSFTLPLAP